MKHLEDAVVISIREVRPGIWSMWLKSPKICADARPGQFLHVRTTDTFLPLLRRPLSIGRVHGDTLELVWRVVGSGTSVLTDVSEGHSVNLLGPLGNPFTIDDDIQRAVLIAGGLGLPPLVYLYEILTEKKIETTLFLGVRGEADIPMADDDPMFASMQIIAEEGGKFPKGLVVDPARELLCKLGTPGLLGTTAMYSCGPWGLVSALQKVIPGNDLKRAEVSLEQQMACGIGVCQGCATPVKGGGSPYKLVCHDGPVFDLFSVEAPNG